MHHQVPRYLGHADTPFFRTLCGLAPTVAPSCTGLAARPPYNTRPTRKARKRSMQRLQQPSASLDRRANVSGRTRMTTSTFRGTRKDTLQHTRMPATKLDIVECAGAHGAALRRRFVTLRATSGGRWLLSGYLAKQMGRSKHTRSGLQAMGLGHICVWERSLSVGASSSKALPDIPAQQFAHASKRRFTSCRQACDPMFLR